MAFLTLEDLYGTAEILVFPNTYEQYRELLADDGKIFVKGRVSAEEDADSKLIASVIAPMNQPEKLYEGPRRRNFNQNSAPQPGRPSAPKPALLWLRLADRKQWEQQQNEICRILQSDPGDRPVRIYLQSENERLRAPSKYDTSASERTMAALRALLGNENVI